MGQAPVGCFSKRPESNKQNKIIPIRFSSTHYNGCLTPCKPKQQAHSPKPKKPDKRNEHVPLEPSIWITLSEMILFY